MTSPPDFHISYTSSTIDLLRFFFLPTAEADTTLIVNAPDNLFYCSDDSYGTSNPTVDFANPGSGRYDVWIGKFSEGPNAPGTFYLTERQSVTPLDPDGL